MRKASPRAPSAASPGPPKWWRKNSPRWAEDGGRLAVIAPGARIADLARAIPAAVPGDRTEVLDSPVALLTVGQSKGLEFDRVVLVDPAGILAQSPAGGHDLYVAITRATHRLTVVHDGDLPPSLHRLAPCHPPMHAPSVRLPARGPNDHDPEPVARGAAGAGGRARAGQPARSPRRRVPGGPGHRGRRDAWARSRPAWPSRSMNSAWCPAFDAVYGASAGAITAAWLLSRPEGLRGWTEPAYARAFIRRSGLLRGRPVADVRALIEELYQTTFPMDFAAVLASPIEFHPLATDAATGQSDRPAPAGHHPRRAAPGPAGQRRPAAAGGPAGGVRRPPLLRRRRCPSPSPTAPPWPRAPRTCSSCAPAATRACQRRLAHRRPHAPAPFGSACIARTTLRRESPALRADLPGPRRPAEPPTTAA